MKNQNFKSKVAMSAVKLVSRKHGNQHKSQKYSKPMKELYKYLKRIKPGPIKDIVKLESHLVECWYDFNGSSQKGMHAEPLYGRMENVRWEPPILSFHIKRHRGRVCRTSRAESQKWYLNIDTWKAHRGLDGYRFLRPWQRKTDLDLIAREVARAIVERKPDERLKWYNDGLVTVLIGKIIPKDSAGQQTIIGHRKRFRTAVEQYLYVAG